MAERYRKERLDPFIEACRKAGGKVHIDFKTGKATIDFGAANDAPAEPATPTPTPAEAAAAERQRKMAERMRQPKSPA